MTTPVPPAEVFTAPTALAALQALSQIPSDLLDDEIRGRILDECWARQADADRRDDLHARSGALSDAVASGADVSALLAAATVSASADAVLAALPPVQPVDLDEVDAGTINARLIRVGLPAAPRPLAAAIERSRYLETFAPPARDRVPGPAWTTPELALQARGEYLVEALAASRDLDRQHASIDHGGRLGALVAACSLNAAKAALAEDIRTYDAEVEACNRRRRKLGLTWSPDPLLV